MPQTRRFYCQRPPASGRAELTGPEARHALRVVRLRPGDEATLFDGAGREYSARLTEAGRRNAVFEILAERACDRELPVRVAVASAVPKGRRADFLVEKLAELGAAEWIPLRCGRSAADPLASGANRRARWERIAVEASKQCGRNRVMRIGEPRDWQTLLGEANRFGARWLCAAHAPMPPRQGAAAEAALVAVGPEGGFTDEEEAAGVQAGFQPLALAPAVLRVETAALAALVKAASLCAGGPP